MLSPLLVSLDLYVTHCSVASVCGTTLMDTSFVASVTKTASFLAPLPLSPSLSATSGAHFHFVMSVHVYQFPLVLLATGKALPQVPLLFLKFVTFLPTIKFF